MKSAIVIHMGATEFTADVRDKAGKMVHFDLNRLGTKNRQKNQRTFIKELVVAYREAGL